MKITILFFGLYLIGQVWCQNTSKNPGFTERFLSRRKRYLIFPPGSAIVATLSYTKSLVPRSPSGINIISEVDIFYPLQTKVTDFFPRPPTKNPPPPPPFEPEEDPDRPIGPAVRPPSPPAPAPAPTRPNQSKPPPQVLEDGDDNYNSQNHPGEIYVTGPPPRRIDSSEYINEHMYHNSPYGHSYKEQYFWRSPTSRYPMSPVRYDGPPVHGRHRPSDNQPYHMSYSNEDELLRADFESIRPPDTVLYSRQQPTYRNWNDARKYPINGSGGYHRPQGRIQRHVDSHEQENKLSETIDENEDEIEKHKDWHHYHAYKERRDIFEQLKAITSFQGFNVTTCIHRLICEANHFLLSPGKSLFQDIFRILFTLPLRDGFNDEYSTAMSKNITECRAHFGAGCRYSILGYLLHNQMKISQ